MARPLFLAMAFLFAAPALAGDGQPAARDEEVEVPDVVREAVEHGLEYLVAHQSHTGAFAEETEYKVAVTALSCLSLMAGGHVPGKGAFGENVKRGIFYILDQCQGESGYIKRRDDRSRMHGHGYAMLMLAEAYGMTDNDLRERIRVGLRDAIELTEKHQTKEGGWGYEPADTIHEGSVTVVQLQALRAARNAGLVVGEATLEKAKEYLRLSANLDGSFKYRLDQPGGRSSFPLTAAGVASLQARGDYAADEIKRGLEFMEKYRYPDGDITDRYYVNFFYYGQYYAAQAMYHAQERHYWKEWYPAMVRQLVTSTDASLYYHPYRSGPESGYWSRCRYGDAYATAVVTLILQIPFKYLPIFQR